MTASGQTLYLSELNEGDYCFRYQQGDTNPGGRLGQTFQPAATVAYDRSSGRSMGSIPNPPDLFGRLGAVNLYVHIDILMQTILDVAAQGLYMYDTESLGFLGWITRPFANHGDNAAEWLAGNRYRSRNS